jgi:hypothetical protein
MNKERRKRIADAIAAIGKIESLVQNILDDEQEAYDNMLEGVKSSENGIISEEAQDNLDSAIEALEEAISYLEEI